MSLSNIFLTGFVDRIFILHCFGLHEIKVKNVGKLDNELKITQSISLKTGHFSMCTFTKIKTQTQTF